jgi:hypothetical protein
MTDSASRAADPAPRKLRVLCLHGFHGSGAILREQMKPLFGGVFGVSQEHPGGHVIASTPPTRQAVARFLADMAARRSKNCAAG